MKYEMTKDLETGNSTIDGEHRQLFDAVNRLLEACSAGKGRVSVEPTVKFLLDYVDRHFAHEEELQRRSNYPSMAVHSAFHKGYKQKLRQIADRIPASGPTVATVADLNQHIGALVTHIRTEDKALGAHLRNKNS